MGRLLIFGLGYTAAVSQLLGFVLWYRGMGEIGVTRASQIQLAQPLQVVATLCVVGLACLPGLAQPLQRGREIADRRIEANAAQVGARL